MVNRRSSFSSLLQAEFLAKADEVASNHLSDGEAGRRLSGNVSEAPAAPADMSVILEQSVLTEEIVTGPLKSNLAAGNFKNLTHFRRIDQYKMYLMIIEQLSIKKIVGAN